MPSIAFEILLIFVLVIANGVFAGSEMAIVSSRRVRLEQAAKDGKREALTALKLLNKPNSFLSTVQIGITLIGILSGAVGGATLAARFAKVLASVPQLQPYSELLSIIVIVGAITYLSLVIGELVPKRIALSNPEGLAYRAAGPMTLLARLTAPLVKLLSLSTEATLKLLNIRPAEDIPVTEEEIKVLLQQGAQAGLFEVAEQEIVSRVFRLADRPIKSMMTPRVEIVWLDIEDSTEEHRRDILDSPYSRFPVGRESIDDCLGVVSIKDIWAAQQSGIDFEPASLLQTPLFVLENTPALEVLEQLRESGQSLAMVADEYGGIAGLVTLSDLLEAIVGTLHDVHYDVEPPIVQREDGSFLLDGLLSLDELKEVLKLERLPLEEEDFHSLGGFVLTYLGHIPQEGEHFEASGFRFEVVDMDGARIDKVLVSLTKITEPIEPQDAS
ncbi:MAG: hemolysin family protein [Cyanobacteria bacterium J06635_1]